MRVARRDVRTLRPGTAIGRGHTLAAKALLLIALVLFTVLWLLLAPGTAAAL